MNNTLNVRGRLIQLDAPRLMGILNVTPDSFYDGGRYNDNKAILHHVEKMIEEGATFIDVGGYSSRPGADDIFVEEEVRRTIPVIELILKHFPEVLVSIDTFRTQVARKALEAGAALINDISGGTLDKEMIPLVASFKVPYIAMHMKGTPQTMTGEAIYDDVVKEVVDYFHQKNQTLHAAGVTDIIVDPGFGFAKNIEQNFELLKNLDYLRILGKPLLVGMSRKSLIWKTLKTNPEMALNGTTVLNTVALMKGASILRIHDVKEAAEAIKLTKFVM